MPLRVGRNLADVDNDGKLTSEEFCLAMYLVELAAAHQPLPQKLPPDLLPPSYRRSRSGSGLVGAAAGIAPPPGAPTPGTYPRGRPAARPQHGPQRERVRIMRVARG